MDSDLKNQAEKKEIKEFGLLNFLAINKKRKKENSTNLIQNFFKMSLQNKKSNI